MRFTIYDWSFCRGGPNVLVGYSHAQSIDGDIFEVAKSLFDKGLNVMVCQKTEDIDAILYVDTKKFTYR